MLAALFATASFAHSGGTDANGCHTNSKTGDYHCHGAPAPRPAPVYRPAPAAPAAPASRPVSAPAIVVVAPVPAPTMLADGTHEVTSCRITTRSGDTWPGVAREFGITEDALHAMNPDLRRDHIATGVRLMVQEGCPDDPLPSSPSSSLVFAPPEWAGRLATGFKGIPFGDAGALRSAPLPGCTRGADGETAWTCKHRIGSTAVMAVFYASHSIYWGFGLATDGWDECSDVLRALQSAYGPGSPDSRLPEQYESSSVSVDRVWQEGAVSAYWSYNQFTDECAFVAKDSEWKWKMNAAKERDAAKAAADDL